MATTSLSRKKTWERRLDEAKRKHRPKLVNWSRDEFAFKRESAFLALSKPINHSSSIIYTYNNRSSVLFSQMSNKSFMISNLDYNDLCVEKFKNEFENVYIPCIINNIPLMEKWSAINNWSLKALKKNYSDRLFKVGEDDDGYKVKAKLKYFLKYMKNNKDDSPLYVFDGNYDSDSISKKILTEYKVPKYFTDDLFSLVGEKRRPPYRWFLIGPERSGSGVHIDPLGTSAWNTVIVGRKRWVLFPPDTPKKVAKGLDVIKKGEDDEAINYFVDLLPRIKDTYKDIHIIEFIQESGETVFVPGGWWHGVLNLEHTVAITQNFCSYGNFDRVWLKTRSQRKKMAGKWLEKLKEFHPTLAKRAEQLNEMDEFVMYNKNNSSKDNSNSDSNNTKNNNNGSTNTSTETRSFQETSKHKRKSNEINDENRDSNKKLKKYS
eukprot:gene13794-18502_t